MKKIRTLTILSISAVCLSGCFAPATLQYDVRSIKSKIAALENSVARQNLNIQNTQREVSSLTDKTNKLSMDVNGLRRQVSNVSARPAVAPAPVQYSSVSSSNDEILSDKLTYTPTISEVQIALRNAGYYKGAIDGKAGSGTKAAIRSFQKDSGLTQDGIIGNQTWSKLKKY